MTLDIYAHDLEVRIQRFSNAGNHLQRSPNVARLTEAVFCKFFKVFDHVTGILQPRYIFLDVLWEDTLELLVNAGENGLWVTLSSIS